MRLPRSSTAGNQGRVVPLPDSVHPDTVDAFAGPPSTVAPGATRPRTWGAATTDGRYDFTVHGPDGFVRRFVGAVTAPTGTRSTQRYAAPCTDPPRRAKAPPILR
ncbi:phospholipase domain-containing protein [Kitasatospora sp. NPDC005751]|uniref:phospholipase domain-containing protein n=1 Tax=Kitasatospora sp. NPDC005751 TaxID=3157064 RepID=UPI0033D826AA